MKKNNASTNPTMLIAGLIILAVGIAVGYALGSTPGASYGSKTTHAPSNFEECVAQGNPIMESYPRQCRSKEGKLFVEQIAVPPTPPPQTPPSNGGSAKKCVVGGCSGTICQSADEEPAITTCEYRSEYACYKTARCEVQASGECGWTQSATLIACLKAPPPLR